MDDVMSSAELSRDGRGRRRLACGNWLSATAKTDWRYRLPPTIALHAALIVDRAALHLA